MSASEDQRVRSMPKMECAKKGNDENRYTAKIAIIDVSRCFRVEKMKVTYKTASLIKKIVSNVSGSL